jgi:hypothetical protein
MGQLTGPQLFLRYAWPCAEDRLHIKLISQDDFEKLRWLILDKAEPEICFLEKCFPGAVKALKDFSFASGSTDIWSMWSFGNVAQFWRHNHGHNGDCAVTIGIVLSVTPTSNLLVDCGKKAFYVPNIYKLDLKKKDQVYLHRKIVIEKA